MGLIHNRLIYSRYVTAKGNQVHEVVNGQEAIEFLQGCVPSLSIGRCRSWTAFPSCT